MLEKTLRQTVNTKVLLHDTHMGARVTMVHNKLGLILYMCFYDYHRKKNTLELFVAYFFPDQFF